MQSQIEEAAYVEARRQEAGESMVIGVNKFNVDAIAPVPALAVDPDLEADQIKRLSEWKRERDQGLVDAALEKVTKTANTSRQPPLSDEGSLGRRRHGGRGLRCFAPRVRGLSPVTTAGSPLRFLIIGAGPAGTAAATAAAALGAKVTLVERQVVGGAAHLRDCIPSKTMTATAVRIDSMRNAAKLGVMSAPGQVDPQQLTERIESITGDIHRRWVSLLRSQGVEIIEGTGRLVGPNEAIVEGDAGTRRVGFDRCLISTGSAPRVPPWAKVDGERILTTRDAYGLPEIPKHLVVIGSGVTGVEFVHIFESLGSDVTLVVSRQQILPHRDPEVAAVLEENFLERGVKLLIGARATGIETNRRRSRCDL